jgi:hypothetical protein
MVPLFLKTLWRPAYAWGLVLVRFGGDAHKRADRGHADNRAENPLLYPFGCVEGGGKARKGEGKLDGAPGAILEHRPARLIAHLERGYEVVAELGIGNARGTIGTMMLTAIRILKDDPNRLLIIDEADKLVDKGIIELVRDIYKGAKVPVLLVGEELLPEKLARYERCENRVSAPSTC